MRQRAMTAAILVPVLLIVLAVGGIAMAAAVALITVLAAREVFGLLDQSGHHTFWLLGTALALTVILDATFPPGSVSGAPKSSALRTIADLEPVPRGPYCGAIGWVDADRGEAELAVGIRTFWAEHDATGERWLRFGTGAGITWGSDPEGEWAETQLKAARLVGLASGRVGAVSSRPGRARAG